MMYNFSPAALSARIDPLLDAVLQQQRLVGAVVLVRQRGQDVYRRAAGQLDREAGTPMREDAVFRLASVSKPIVSTAALALVGQHRLGLDDLVARWLPYFTPCQPDGSVAAITVRHLLTHTAGLDYGFFQPPGGAYAQAGVSDGMDASSTSLEDNLRRLATVPLAYAPGERWAYSIATDVLGAVIEAVTGLPLAHAVAQLVTAPLAMRDTGFICTDAARLAVAYADRAAGELQPRRLRDEGEEHLPFLDGMAGFTLSPARARDAHAYPSGGAGMLGSAPDFMRLLETLRQGVAPLLPPALARQLGENQTAAFDLPFWPGRGFGLGFTVLTDPQLAATPETAGTWRMGGTYGHSWFVDPAQELSVVAFTNTALEGMAGPFVTELCQAVYGVEQGQ
ncbi:serine hydrolase domain-containing protein [Janthinobacterium tructae]|uniref:serine hydrolase domain-containing protein n=1 Tax=Janthinobacterium tructae TaxID=2590869 RepID=UPI00249AE816|nr:serine hydrolase domain-containing protein [Janthinobacterium tructae]MDI3297168.1 serine hydrolase domain-containing protein [Janthinobacterium tructae]